MSLEEQKKTSALFFMWKKLSNNCKSMSSQCSYHLNMEDRFLFLKHFCHWRTFSQTDFTSSLFIFPLPQEEIAKRSAQYQHLTNMELISLLLQQEMDMQKQQAASEQQETQLRKCEAELKKVKLQVRDLEDYIDNLLLRIMEQTPTLLQVRQRHKWWQSTWKH